MSMQVIPPVAITSTGTHTRSTVAGYWNSLGKWASAAINVLRVSFNPLDLAAAPQVLLESAATNYAWYSRELDNAYWLKFQVSVTADVAEGPDGTMSMDLLTATVPGSSVVYRGGIAPGQKVISAIFKAGTRDRPFFSVDGIGSATFNTSIEAQIAGALSGSITHLGGGFYLCEAAYFETAGSSVINIGMNSAVVGDTIYVCDIQVEDGTKATSRIVTAGATATRAADVITGTGLISSSIAEPDAGMGEATAYSTASTYALGDEVYSLTTHRRYASVQAANTNHPLPVWPELDTLWWTDLGPTNRWAAFDVLQNTASTDAGPVTYVFRPGVRVDSLALLGMVATSVTIGMYDGTTLVYSYTADLNERVVEDWYDYFFAPFSTQPAVTLFDLPPYSQGVITVSLLNSTGEVSLGACVVGQAVEIGEVQYSAENDVLNFSTVTRDADGAARMEQSRNVPKTIQSIYAEKSNINRIRTVRDALNGSAAVWVGITDATDGYAESLRILGFYRRFTINLRHPEHAVISLELEEI